MIVSAASDALALELHHDTDLLSRFLARLRAPSKIVSPMRKLTAIFLVILCLPIPSFAWGPEGHEIVADIARVRLNQAARRHVRELLGSDDLASISTWADDVRPLRLETYGWHFVDIPWNSQGFSQPRDCFHFDEQHREANQDHHNCVVDRIEIFERVLGDRNASNADRVEALKFLVHFVGDVHQPLHAVEEARGGNGIHVKEFGSSHCGTRPCNLHLLWDVGLIEHTRRNEAAYDAYLERFIAQRNLQKRAGGTPEDWANESFHLAHQVWLSEGDRVDEAYYNNNIEVVNERLALAGLRLATLLNQALGR